MWQAGRWKRSAFVAGSLPEDSLIRARGRSSLRATDHAFANTRADDIRDHTSVGQIRIDPEAAPSPRRRGGPSATRGDTSDVRIRSRMSSARDVAKCRGVGNPKRHAREISKDSSQARNDTARLGGNRCVGDGEIGAAHSPADVVPWIRLCRMRSAHGFFAPLRMTCLWATPVPDGPPGMVKNANTLATGRNMSG